MCNIYIYIYNYKKKNVNYDLKSLEIFELLQESEFYLTKVGLLGFIKLVI